MSKRTRPCNACRARKTKCSIESPGSACAFCQSQGHICAFDDKVGYKRRRLTSPTWSQAQANQHSVRATISGTGLEEYDALPEGTTLLKRTLGLQNAHHSQYLGINNPLLFNPIATQDVDGRVSTNIRYVHKDHTFRILPDSAVTTHAWEIPVLDAIEEFVQGHGKALVELYFRIIHPAFPILHREVFLEKYGRSYQEFSPPLLAAVYLSASAYWSYSDSLAAQARPEMRPLKQLALDSLQMAMNCAKLSTVQACLLITQYEAQEPECLSGEASLNLTAQLVQLAHRLGLHLDAGGWDIPPWEIRLRRRLSWACIMQDMWLAFVHGHPPFINLDCWDVLDLSTGDFPDTDENDAAGSSEVEKGRLVFTYMTSLTKILSDSVISIFSPRAQRGLQDMKSLPEVLNHIKPIQIQLKAWFSKLPTNLKMDTAANMKLSSVGYLRLAYLAIEASIHLVVVKAIVRGVSHQPGLARICRNASIERLRNACDFFSTLSASQLAAFWNLTSAECAVLIYRFGQTLHATASDADEQAAVAEKVKACHWCFKLNSQSGISFAKRTLSILEAARTLGATESATAMPSP